MRLLRLSPALFWPPFEAELQQPRGPLLPPAEQHHKGSGLSIRPWASSHQHQAVAQACWIWVGMHGEESRAERGVANGCCWQDYSAAAPHCNPCRAVPALSPYVGEMIRQRRSYRLSFPSLPCHPPLPVTLCSLRPQCSSLHRSPPHHVSHLQQQQWLSDGLTPYCRAVTRTWGHATESSGRLSMAWLSHLLCSKLVIRLSPPLWGTVSQFDEAPPARWFCRAQQCETLGSSLLLNKQNRTGARTFMFRP